MPQLLTLSRAAHLIGVSRGTLQKRIGAGELPSFDGMVSTADLLNLYPDLRLEDSGAFEQVADIKEQAFARRVRERMLPSQEVLAQRLFDQGQEVTDLRRHLARYHDLVSGLQARIADLRAAMPSPVLAELERTLEDGLAAVLGSEERPDPLVALDAMLRVMAAHVSVRPSGHEFFVEGAETVLKGALRAGLAPSYGCGNGTCGLCKARIVSGQTRQVQHSDYPLSEAEKAQGHVLLCCHAPVGDLVVEMLEADSPADIPEQTVAAKVRAVTPLSATVTQLHLQTPRTHRLRFLAGQRVSLGTNLGGTDFSAEYPIASCPCDDRNILFHVRRGADPLAGRLFDGSLKAGETVTIRGPFGDFCLTGDVKGPLVFVACDTGFAPVQSLIEHAIAMDSGQPITLVLASTAPDGHYLAKQARAWADALDEFSLRVVDSDSPAAAARRVADLAGDAAAAASEAFVAGDPEFIEYLQRALADAGAGFGRLLFSAV
ncbi:MAG: 2Fe-2S iron-sulfur cluster binding domain-containing protein [Rhodocyclaceae bacterium]|nr:2Fe-2S iron-sulfur cluster binding domain-containing protein [Rhodocyclaceae bacterium]